MPYEAPQGRRLNAIGGYISHGPDAGTFHYAVYASLPKSKSKKQRKSPEEIAASYGLSPENEVGPIDSDRFLAFLWQLAGRPPIYASDWKRARPLYIVLDNYSVHKGEPVKAASSAIRSRQRAFVLLACVQSAVVGHRTGLAGGEASRNADAQPHRTSKR